MADTRDSVATAAMASVRAVVRGEAAGHVHTDRDELVRAYREYIPTLEQELWEHGCSATLLERYQAAHRQMERLIAGQGDDPRHKVVVVVSVADRPQLLKSCLDSLARLCELYRYGGFRNGRYPKVAVLIADDSREDLNRTRHRALARTCEERGIETHYCGPEEQLAWVDALAPEQRARLARILGAAPRGAYFHKGSSIMRNISYLKLRELWRESREPLLFHFIDSDQEFRVKVATQNGDRDLYALSYFHALDRLFAESDALVATGKVVGDPPTSPAVMTSSFLDDVIGFLEQLGETAPHEPCAFHERVEAGGQGGAIYHDMPELFGFTAKPSACDYACTLGGHHGNGACLDEFAGRLNRFFDGEHPTRKTRFKYAGADLGARPARTVYAGNYMMRPEGLSHFLPFAPLKLRMPGPTLGRMVKAEIGGRFVEANLPMLHGRTVDGTGDAEYRPGIDHGSEAIDLGGEFVRQFYGDVMLFSMEKLTAAGYPLRVLEQETILAALEETRGEMLAAYNKRQGVIGGKLERLHKLLSDPQAWWNHSANHTTALAHCRRFADNVEYNFGENAAAYARINGAADWAARRDELADAIAAYHDDRAAWELVLFGA